MQKILILILFAIALLSACKQDSKTSATEQESQTASPQLLDGHWIAMDFCARANQYGSVLQAMNNAHKPYSYSLTFDRANPDSAGCFNGFETWKLPVKYNADTLELVGAVQGKSVFLVYHSEGEKDMTMFDVTSGTAKMDRFIKSKAGTATGDLAFLVALNHNVLGGTFIPLGKGAAGNVQFTPGGTIQGLKGYDKYELCTGGDCFVAGDAMDIITLSDSQTENSEKLFGFRLSANNDTLTIYNMLNTKPDEKSAYTIGKPAYQFLKKKVK